MSRNIQLWVGDEDQDSFEATCRYLYHAANGEHLIQPVKESRDSEFVHGSNFVFVSRLAIGTISQCRFEVDGLQFDARVSLDLNDKEKSFEWEQQCVEIAMGFLREKKGDLLFLDDEVPVFRRKQGKPQLNVEQLSDEESFANVHALMSAFSAIGMSPEPVRMAVP